MSLKYAMAGVAAISGVAGVVGGVMATDYLAEDLTGLPHMGKLALGSTLAAGGGASLLAFTETGRNITKSAGRMAVDAVKGVGDVGRDKFNSIQGNPLMSGQVGRARQTGRSVGGTVGRAGKNVIKVAAGAEKMTSGLVNKVVNATGRSWDRKGIGATLGGAAKLGMLYGGLTTSIDLSLNAHVSDEAMANSQYGSAYSGDAGFGTRKESAVKSMGQSTQGINFGLHNKRHG